MVQPINSSAREMISEEAFRSLLRDTLLPMFPGIDIGKTVVSTGRHNLIAYGNGYASILVKPHLEALYRVPLFRSLPFKPEEFKLISTFIEEVASCSNHSA